MRREQLLLVDSHVMPEAGESCHGTTIVINAIEKAVIPPILLHSKGRYAYDCDASNDMAADHSTLGHSEPQTLEAKKTWCAAQKSQALGSVVRFSEDFYGIPLSKAAAALGSAKQVVISANIPPAAVNVQLGSSWIDASSSVPLWHIATMAASTAARLISKGRTAIAAKLLKGVPQQGLHRHLKSPASTASLPNPSRINVRRHGTDEASYHGHP